MQNENENKPCEIGTVFRYCEKHQRDYSYKKLIRLTEKTAYFISCNARGLEYNKGGGNDFRERIDQYFWHRYRSCIVDIEKATAINSFEIMIGMLGDAGLFAREMQTTQKYEALMLIDTQNIKTAAEKVEQLAKYIAGEIAAIKELLK